MLLHFVLLWKHHISSAVCFLLQWTFYSPWAEWITPSKWKGAGPRGSFYEPIVFNYYRIILCNLVIMNLFYQNRHNSFEVNTLDTETDAPCNQLLYFFLKMHYCCTLFYYQGYTGLLETVFVFFINEHVVHHEKNA